MQRPEGMQKLALAALIATSALVILAAAVWGIRLFAVSRNQAVIQSTNPASYPLGGFPMAGHLAPDFTLSTGYHKSVPPLTGGARADRLRVGGETHAWSQTHSSNCIDR